MSKCACGGRVFEFFHDSSWDVLLNTLSKTCNGRYNGSQSSVLASLYVIIAGRGAHTRRFARSRTFYASLADSTDVQSYTLFGISSHSNHSIGRQSYEVSIVIAYSYKGF